MGDGLRVMEIRLTGSGKQRQPGHRATTFASEEAQEIQVSIVDEVHAARAEGNFNDATAYVAQGMAQSRQFLLAGIATGQRPAAIADVITRCRGGKTKRPSLHSLAQQSGAW